MTASLSAVIPVKLTGRHYSHNIGFCDLLFGSFRHFGMTELLTEIILIVPTKERAAVEAYMGRWNDFPLKTVSDDELLPAFAERSRRPDPVGPWFRQQVIKMACSQMVQSPFYLSLDPDVIAVKKIQLGDLVCGGRALLDTEAREVHPQWWMDGARMLDVAPSLERPGMHVTPVIYARDVWARCFERLEEVHHRSWTETLLTTRAVWTEMSLYFLTLETFFEVEDFHFIAEEAAPHLHSETEFWTREDFKELDLSLLFDDSNRGLFAVLSSSAKVQPRTLADCLRPWIPIEVQPYKPRSALLGRGTDLYDKVVRRLR